jgi:hypothetical protein
MSDPTISISYLSTSGQFSSSQMAIEYGSSPVEHGTDQIRIACAWPFVTQPFGEEIGVRQRS